MLEHGRPSPLGLTMNHLRNLPHIGRELFARFAALFVVRRAQDRGRVNGGHYKWRERRLDQFATTLAHPKTFAEQRLRGGGAEANEDGRLYHVQLRLKPRMARCDFAAVWLLVNAPLANGLPLEMLHDVCDVNLVAVDSHFLQNLVEEFSGRTHEWAASKVFIVARLFADEHHLRIGRAFAEDCLGTSFPQRTGSAT